MTARPTTKATPIRIPTPRPIFAPVLSPADDDEEAEDVAVGALDATVVGRGVLLLADVEGDSVVLAIEVDVDDVDDVPI